MSEPRDEVLVVEDDDDIRALVLESLAGEHLAVRVAATIAEARASVRGMRPDLVVLDLTLPDGSGLDLLRELAGTAVPVLVLSGRGGELDRVLGLELGADDYVVKPFFPRELAARVRRALRRAAASSVRLDLGGGLVVDVDSREVRVGARLVELTDREFDLLAHLGQAPRRVFSRADLLRDVWRSSPEWQSPKTVTEHVRRIRAKLGTSPDGHAWIVTVGSTGYRLDPAPAV